jgi:hypothetical protein
MAGELLLVVEDNEKEPKARRDGLSASLLPANDLIW